MVRRVSQGKQRNSEVQAKDSEPPSYPVRQLGGRGSFAASVPGPKAGVAEEARTRGFAAPAFAGCAFVSMGILGIEPTVCLGTCSVKDRPRCAAP